MLTLSSSQVIPSWCRLGGRRPAGEAEIRWALQSPAWSRTVWSVPVTLTDSEPVRSEVDLYHAIRQCLAGREAVES